MRIRGYKWHGISTEPCIKEIRMSVYTWMLLLTLPCINVPPGMNYKYTLTSRQSTSAADTELFIRHVAFRKNKVHNLLTVCVLYLL